MYDLLLQTGYEHKQAGVAFPLAKECAGVAARTCTSHELDQPNSSNQFLCTKLFVELPASLLV